MHYCPQFHMSTLFDLHKKQFQKKVRLMEWLSTFVHGMALDITHGTNK